MMAEHDGAQFKKSWIMGNPITRGPYVVENQSHKSVHSFEIRGPGS